MKDLSELPVDELAALVCEALRAAGITVTLTGGSCVAIWSSGKYVSHDLDFIEEGPVSRRQITTAIASLGFSPEGRHFVHPRCRYLVEFPTGPLMVGDERVQHVSTRRTRVGELRLLSPTDCVKDRLAAYFHWNDGQALEQALLVARAQDIHLNELRRWSANEGSLAKFTTFRRRLAQTRHPPAV